MNVEALAGCVFASVDDVIAKSMRAWRPPPRLSLSEWSDKNFRLSAESAAEPGRWHTLPYQRGIMDAITDPAVTQLTFEKSARVGYTLMISAAIAYHMDHEPTSILVVQPTVDDAKGYSKETIAPMIRDVPVLANKVFEDLEEGPKGSSNTIQHKTFPGGVLSLIGANSGTGFRRISRRVVIFDEVDAYPASAGSDGDPIELGTKRAEFFWNRKIIAGSTPLLAGSSRIQELFEQGDQRRYFVPCPQCGHMAPLVFRKIAKGEDGVRGHRMTWPPGEPKKAFFACEKNGCVIEHKDKRAMVERGEWRAAKPFEGHASFHLWAAYSFSPNATWGKIAEDFVKANAAGPEKLKTFVNTTLGEVWQEKGEAPEWRKLYDRRTPRPEKLPPEVLLLTAGVDVQRDRLIYEVVGWGADRRSWGIEADEIYGNTALLVGGPWDELDKLLLKTWTAADGTLAAIRRLAVDSGDQTQTVYAWARRYPLSRVIATKGAAAAKALIDRPTKVDVTIDGRKLARAYRVWPIGVNIAKSELYGWLQLDPPTDEARAQGAAFPPGFCHFFDDGGYGEAFFKQLTAERLVEVRQRRSGVTRREWKVIAGRENHHLDTRVLARVAAAHAGLDRHAAAHGSRPPPAPPATTTAPAPPPPRPRPVEASPRRPSATGGNWLGGRGKGWFRR